MGTVFYVGCYDCMVYRDLDKFYALLQDVNNHQEAIGLAEKLQEGAFKAALLVSFMGKHTGHKCTVFSEHDSAYYDFDPDHDYDDKNADYDFWQTEVKAPPTSDRT